MEQFIAKLGLGIECPYKQTIKALKKQIKRIERDKDRSYAQLERLFDRAIQVTRPSLPIIDAKVVQKKKK